MTDLYVDTVRVTFPDCHHTITWQRSQALPAHCPNCTTNVQSNGRCEDFPCCGHTLEEGCGFSPTHTGEYWSEWIDKREAAGWDRDDPDFYPEEY